MSFEDSVTHTPDVAKALCKGLQALGKNSTLVHAEDTHSINGSVDIDGTVKEKYPNEARWDYVIGYKDRAYFIEVHPATSSDNIKEVIKKLYWLKGWLENEAPLIREMKSADTPYIWAYTCGVKLLPTSKQFRLIAQNGIKLVKRVELR